MKIAAVAEHVEHVAVTQHVGAHAIAVGPEATHKTAIHLGQKMHVAFEVRHGQVTAHRHWPAESAPAQRILSPALALAGAQESYDRAIFIRGVDVAKPL